MKDRKRKIKNPCVVCGNEVRWGIDGCPIVEKGKEFETLLRFGYLRSCLCRYSNL